MRIDIVGLNYKPEVTGIAPYTADVAEGLTRRGHDVHVFTGFPHYPEWHADPRYGGPTISETINGVAVTRLRHYVPAVMSVAERTRLELSFGRRLLRSGLGDCDALVAVSPALLSASMALGSAKVHRRRPATGVWVQDLYSRGVIETGAMQGVSADAIARVESRVLRSADGVAVIHDRFAAHVVENLGVDRGAVSVIPNWSHLPDVTPTERNAARDLLGWNRNRTIALHAGNMGLKQGLENVVEAARLSDVVGSDVDFVFIGDGNQRGQLEELGRGIGSLTFMRPLPERLFVAALCAADVLLLNERPDVCEMAVPSKLTSYFGSGTPVVAATAAGSVTHSEIVRSGAGVRVDPDDPNALLDAVCKLAADPVRSDELGIAGLRHLHREMSRDTAIDRVESWVTSLRHGRRTRRGSVATRSSVGSAPAPWTASPAPIL